MSKFKYYRKTINHPGDTPNERLIIDADENEVARFPITQAGTAAYNRFCEGVWEADGDVVSYLFQYVTPERKRA